MIKPAVSVIALGIALAIGSSCAEAGMSGTSARVQETTNSEMQPPAQGQPQAKPQSVPPDTGNFDGVWAVSSSRGCGLNARSAVEVKRGRISGQGVSGSIDAGGNVRTVGRGGGLSVVSTGRAAGSSASGTYRVSNGCAGTWSAKRA